MTTTATATATATAPIDDTYFRQTKEIEDYLSAMLDRETLTDDDIDNSIAKYEMLSYIYHCAPYTGDLGDEFERCTYYAVDTCRRLFQKILPMISLENNYHSAWLIASLLYRGYLDDDYHPMFDIISGTLDICVHKTEEYCDVVKYIVADYRDMFEKSKHIPVVNIERRDLLDRIDLMHLYRMDDGNATIYKSERQFKTERQTLMLNIFRIVERREILVDYCYEVIERERAWRRRRIVIMQKALKETL